MRRYPWITRNKRWVRESYSLEETLLVNWHEKLCQDRLPFKPGDWQNMKRWRWPVREFRSRWRVLRPNMGPHGHWY